MASAEAKHCRGVEPRRGAGRRDLGTRARASMCRIQRVSFQSKHLRRSVEPRRDAGRRNLGTRIRYPNKSHSTNKPSAIAALGNKSAPPQSTKNFPHEHPHKPKRAKFPPRMGGCSWGKFSVREGGLEGESPVFQEGALSLQGLLPFSLQGLFLSPRAYTTGGDEDEGKD